MAIAEPKTATPRTHRPTRTQSAGRSVPTGGPPIRHQSDRLCHVARFSEARVYSRIAQIGDDEHDHYREGVRRKPSEGLADLPLQVVIRPLTDAAATPIARATTSRGSCNC